MNESMITFTMVNQSSPVSIYMRTVNATGGSSAQDRKIWMLEPSYTNSTPTTVSYGTGQILASNVVSLYFTYPKIADTSRIQVSLSMQQAPLQNKPPVSYMTTEVIYVRN
jgi:hypothetical protein